MESFDNFYNFVKCIHQEQSTRDTKSIDGSEHIELLEIIKDEPNTDGRFDLDDIAGSIDSTNAVPKCEEVEADTLNETRKTRHSKRSRTASPSTSTETITKKFKTDSHSSLLSKYFNMSCDLCDTLLLSFRHTNKHYKDVHDVDKGYLICCSKKFYRLQHMLQHCEWHINPDSFK